MLGIQLKRVGIDDLSQRVVFDEHDPGIVAEALTQASLDPRLQRHTIGIVPVGLGLETYVAGGQHRAHGRCAARLLSTTPLQRVVRAVARASARPIHRIHSACDGNLLQPNPRAHTATAQSMHARIGQNADQKRAKLHF